RHGKPARHDPEIPIGSPHVKADSERPGFQARRRPRGGSCTTMPLLCYVVLSIHIELEPESVELARGKFVRHDALLSPARPPGALVGAADHKTLGIGGHKNPRFHIA